MSSEVLEMDARAEVCLAREDEMRSTESWPALAIVSGCGMGACTVRLGFGSVLESCVVGDAAQHRGDVEMTPSVAFTVSEDLLLLHTF